MEIISFWHIFLRIATTSTRTELKLQVGYAQNCPPFAFLGIVLIFCTLFSTVVSGQIDTSYVRANSSVQELFELGDSKDKDVKTTVASQIELPLRETPSIVTVITEEDIIRSGARDLRELLMMVPGIDFETDVQNITGMGIRGLWGHEGKVLVLWDGLTINETSYGTFSFKEHIFLGNINRIEVIRGPGSAIYGGMAGLGVINIISKNYAETNTGGRLSQSFGISQGQLARQTMQLGLGKQWNNGFLLNTHGTISRSNISNRQLGDSVSYADSSAINTNQFGAQASYKNVNLTFLYDGHKVDDVEKVGRSVFNGWYGQLKYQYRFSEKLILLPLISLKLQQPWNFENVHGPEGTYTNVNNRRQLTGLRLLYEPNENFSLISGTEYTLDHSRYVYAGNYFSNDKRAIGFNDLAFFAQSIYRLKYVTITGGARVDIHNYFGTAFVPRVGLTKVGKNWHAKLLYSDAFKAPTIINLNVNNSIRPEHISSSELEVGYQKDESLAFISNLFFTHLTNPILYYSTDGLTDSYNNGSSTGTYGFEFSATSRKTWGKLHANYSFYHSANNKVAVYEAVGRPNVLLGFPSHKVVFQAYVNLSDNIALTCTGIFQSSKYYSKHDALNNQNDLIARKPPVLQMNLILTHTHFLYRGFALSAGLYNVLNQTQWMVQPYKDDKNPVPGMGREFSVSLNYQIRQ